MMPPKFVYCEATDGGMDTHELHEEAPSFLLGWMGPGCRAVDGRLMLWMQTAQPGDWHHHRLGVIFCVRGDAT